MPVTHDATLVTWPMFASAFTKSRERRQRLPSSDAAAISTVLSYWELLDTAAHGTAATTCTSPSGDTYVPSALTFDEACGVLRAQFAQREQLWNTLHDRETVQGLLVNVVSTLYIIVAAIAVVVVFGLDVAALLLPLSGFVLGLAFVFGNSLRQLWESLLFIFSSRPFAVGDRVSVPMHGQFPQCFVRKIGLLHVELAATDGRTFLFPTHQLANTVISQLARSRAYAISLVLHLPFSTSRAQLAAMKERLVAWTVEQRRTTGAPYVGEKMLLNVADASNTGGFLAASLWCELRGITWNAPALYNPLRTNLYNAWLDVCRDIGAPFILPPQPVRLLEALPTAKEIGDSNGDANDAKDDHRGAVAIAASTSSSCDDSSNSSSSSD
jgi:small-conductance mechanosensitive channel